MRKFNPNLKRGVSIMEVIISIFVITLVSIASLTTITLSIKHEKAQQRNFIISVTTENAVDCFRFCDDFNEFLLTLKELDDEFLSTEVNKITLDKNVCNFVITTDFTLNVITIDAYQGETLIKQFSYFK